MGNVSGAEEWRRWIKRLIVEMELHGPPNLAIYRWTFGIETSEGIPTCNHKECNEPPLFACVGWVGETMTIGNYEVLLVCEEHAHELVSALLHGQMEDME